MIQQGLPTVGDTVTVVRRFAASIGAVVDARAPTDSSIATLAAPAQIIREGDSIRIVYTLAVWAPGHSDLVLPGAIVVQPSGRVDTLADSHVPLEVASVLPASKSAAAIPPRAASPWLPRSYQSELPFAVLIPVALIVVAALQWRWRLRGPVVAPAVVGAGSAGLTSERVRAWLAAGEARLALDHVEALVRERAEFDEWRGRADAVRFSPGADAAVASLVEEAWSRLGEPDGAPP